MMERTIICISRQYGSGGREIGEAVAKKLGIPCYDKCLIQKAAQEAKLSENVVAEYDEKGEDFGIAVSGNPFADTASLSEAFYSEEARVFDAERRVILELAEKGDCVIIGRCASAILRAAGYHPLSVFIYADSADRAKRIAERNNLDEKRALHSRFVFQLDFVGRRKLLDDCIHFRCFFCRIAAEKRLRLPNAPIYHHIEHICGATGVKSSYAVVYFFVSTDSSDVYSTSAKR